MASQQKRRRRRGGGDYGAGFVLPIAHALHLPAELRRGNPIARAIGKTGIRQTGTKNGKGVAQSGLNLIIC
ncbi:hypothetical protein LMG27198_37490 [Methylocystis echinoides]|uniref:Uncharacterized protein n=1 Tax=Methylocystis echinoides TaxID=29468 RepID=A0A9W6GXE6_9HYPH|nr:hypothetical protein LMG27198_37490 [Methylocystis echinoides]